MLEADIHTNDIHVSHMSKKAPVGIDETYNDIFDMYV